MSNKFKPGDTVINVGGGFNHGRLATVVAVGSFKDAPEADMIVQGKDIKVVKGLDELWKLNQCYTTSRNWEKV